MLIIHEGQIAMDNFTNEVLDKTNQAIKLIVFFLSSSVIIKYFGSTTINDLTTYNSFIDN